MKYLIQEQAKALNQQKCLSQQTLRAPVTLEPLFMVVHSIYLPSL